MLIVEFGSRLNGRARAFSDKDLLIIGDDWQKINQKAAMFSGYSITKFKHDKANYLSANGSLFFKHVIDEGKVISDTENLMSILQNNWQPRLNYNNEIFSNIDLLEILKIVPKNRWSNMFTLDLLIITIRNILIRKLASEGIYSFGWESIFINSMQLKYLSEKDIPLLLYARILKNKYRSFSNTIINEHIIGLLLNITSRLTNTAHKVGYGNEKQLLQSLNGYKSGSYKELRVIELFCLNREYSGELINYKQLISNPNYSCSTKALTKT